MTKASELKSHVEFEMVIRDRNMKVKADLSIVPRGAELATQVAVETFDAETEEQIVMNLTREELASVCRRAAEESKKRGD